MQFHHQVHFSYATLQCLVLILLSSGLAFSSGSYGCGRRAFVILRTVRYFEEVSNIVSAS